MEPQPLISVIIPVYNVERQLRRCLDSVLAQECGKLEVICVNDGSTDGSLDILREYEAKDGRVRVIDKEHAGAGAARNAALDIAQGEWVTGVDSDDWLAPHAYERLMSLDLSEVDAVVYGAETVVESEQPRECFSYELAHEGVRTVTSDDTLRLPSPFWSKLHRRSVIEKYGLRFPEGHIYEDEPFHLLFLAHARSIRYVPEPLYCYSIQRSSVMQQPDREAFEDVNLLYMKEVFEHFVAYDLLGKHWPCLWDYLVHKCLFAAEQNKKGEPLLQWKRDVMRLAQRSGLLRNRRFAKALGAAFTTTRRGWLSRFFVKRKPGKVTYRLFGIPLLKVQRSGSVTTYRVLGVVVHQSVEHF